MDNRGRSVSEDSLRERLRDLMVNSFDVSSDAVVPNADLFKDLGLDSIDLYDSVVCLEEELGVSLDVAEFRDVRTFDDLVTRAFSLTKPST